MNTIDKDNSAKPEMPRSYLMVASPYKLSMIILRSKKA